MSWWSFSHLRRAAGPAGAVLAALALQPGIAQGFETKEARPPGSAAAPASAAARPLLERAQKGSVPVIVRLAAPYRADAALPAAEAAAQRASFAAARERVLARVATGPSGGAGVTGVKPFETIPFFAATVDEAGLRALLADPDVLRVDEDEAAAPTLADTIPLIGADIAWSQGYSGAGQVVAIIDTGVDKSHPFLAGKVVSEACYSSNTYNSDNGSVWKSICPGGVDATTAVGSGVNCDAAALNDSKCEHGTHIAGIAAGKGQSFSGVARDANVIAIKYYSEVTGPDCSGGGHCLLNRASDRIRALERVYALRGSFNIAAAYLGTSIGVSHSAPCDDRPEKLIIDNLRAAKIATVTATGNSDFNGIDAPACISSSIATGSSTKTDTVSSFSNHSQLVTLLAPGESVNSSVPGGGFAVRSGTSQAAAHVVGAWAVLKSRVPGADVDTVRAALVNTGVPLSKDGIAKPRIEVDAAVAALVQPPPAATLVSPAGTTGTQTPNYVWNAVPGSTWYNLYVSDSAQAGRINQWYTAAQAGCAGGDGTCSIAPNTALAAGNATWWIRTWNGNGNGPWSAGKAFTVVPPTQPPPAVTLVSPQGAVGTATPTYVWNAVQSATWYLLYVSDAATTGKIQAWYSAADAGCTGGTGTCEVTPSTSLAPGNGTWWVRSWNSHGYGPWSAGLAFRIVTQPPPAATLVSPSGTVNTAQPTHVWNAVPDATWYYFWIEDSLASPRNTAWRSAAQSGCASGTGTCSRTSWTPYANGAARWWVRTWNEHGFGPWSAPMSFTVNGPTAFDSQFNGSAPNWRAHSGPWSVNGNAYWYTTGNTDSAGNGAHAVSTFDQSFADLDYRARLWRAGCDGCSTGLVVRAGGIVVGGSSAGRGSLSDGYYFMYNRTGYFSVWRYWQGQYLSLSNSTYTPAINKSGAWNDLRVVARGPELTYYINNTKVWSGTDSALARGRVGIDMYRDPYTSGNGLWVDWATLTNLGSGAPVAGGVVEEVAQR